jgi:hypothetical protein
MRLYDFGDVTPCSLVDNIVLEERAAIDVAGTRSARCEEPLD